MAESSAMFFPLIVTDRARSLIRVPLHALHVVSLKYFASRSLRSSLPSCLRFSPLTTPSIVALITPPSRSSPILTGSMYSSLSISSLLNSLSGLSTSKMPLAL
jgi:hypothetical protein